MPVAYQLDVVVPVGQRGVVAPARADVVQQVLVEPVRLWVLVAAELLVAQCEVVTPLQTFLVRWWQLPGGCLDRRRLRGRARG